MSLHLPMQVPVSTLRLYALVNKSTGGILCATVKQWEHATATNQ